MSRSIVRRIHTAHRATAGSRAAGPEAGIVVVLAVFPHHVFAHAPRWSPGPGFTEVMDNWAWIRRRDDGRAEAVSVVYPRIGQPAWDGADQWACDEVWHVLLPTDGGPLVADLWDKPHRIGWIGLPSYDGDGEILSRAPFDVHPLQQVDAWWEEFDRTYGFTPHRLACGRPLLETGRHWLTLHAPDGHRDITWLTDAAVWLHRTFDADIRVYPYDPARGRTTCPRRGAEMFANPFLNLNARRRPARASRTPPRLPRPVRR